MWRMRRARMRRAMWGGWIWIFIVIIILLILFAALRFRWIAWRF